MKIMTMNLNYYVEKHGPWEQRREVVLEVLRAEQPDIVALQAVRQDAHFYDGVDQASQLRQLLPEYEHVTFQPAMSFPDGSVGGSAVLSKIRPVEIGYLGLTLLPDTPDQDQRLVLHARFDVPTVMHLFNAHLSWVSEQASFNLDEALPYMNVFGEPALLVGDLNTPADSPLLERIRAAGWRDVWAELCLDEPGLTFESNSPTIRIDYAWANASLWPAVKGIKIVGNRPHNSGARGSDHFGLVVSLDL
jgi:endonuclease/exonuclease/phosphatase family metal-dependent hydrolase